MLRNTVYYITYFYTLHFLEVGIAKAIHTSRRLKMIRNNRVLPFNPLSRTTWSFLIFLVADQIADIWNKMSV